MKFWITKYALTQGIYEIEGEILTTFNDSVENLNRQGEFFHGKEWHKTKEDTIKRAEEMRKKKIESLKEQINKLENMKFN